MPDAERASPSPWRAAEELGRTASELAGTPVGGTEVAWEATWRTQLKDWLVVQPDVAKRPEVRVVVVTGAESADVDQSGFVDTDDFTAFMAVFSNPC